MRDEIRSSVGAQNLDTSGYQVSDMEVLEFHREDHDLQMDAVFRFGIDGHFFPSTCSDFEMWQWLRNRLCLTKSKIRRTLLLFQKPQSPRDQR